MVQRFADYNALPQQQDMLSEISKLRRYNDNRRFNLAKAIQIYSLDDARALLSDLELYNYCFHSRTGDSLILGKMFIPGFTPTKELHTYVCYDVINQHEARLKGEKAPAYFYPESTMKIKRGSYVYAPPDSWDTIVSSDDLFVVDGVWDCVTLNMLGLPAVALLTSSMTYEVKRILRCFKHLYLVMDNDGAGGRLYSEMLSSFSSVFRVLVPRSIGKDLDEYVVNMGEEFFASQVRLRTNTYLRGDLKHGI